MSSLYLIPMISKPTRLIGNSATLIDNIFMTLPDDCTSGVLSYDLSDHLPVFIIKRNVFMSPDVSNNQNTVSYRLINQNNLDNMYNLLSCQINSIDLNAEVNESLEALIDLIYNIYFSCCPIKTKTISSKKLNKPWISLEISVNIKKKQAYYLLFKQGKLPVTFYNNFRNYVTNQIRTSKKLYYAKKFKEFKNNSKKSWELINSVLNNKNNVSRSISTLSVDGENIDDSSRMANIFNDYFVNVGRNIALSIPCDPTLDHKNYLSGNYRNSFYLFDTCADEVFSIIFAMKNKKCDSINKISVEILKLLAPIISSPLSIIINKCFHQGIFPSLLKKAIVIPVYKSGDKKDSNNYRPISLLHDFSQIFERNLYNRKFDYNDKFDIFHDD